MKTIDDIAFDNLKELVSDMKNCANNLDFYQLAVLKAQFNDAWQIEFANAKRQLASANN